MHSFKCNSKPNLAMRLLLWMMIALFVSSPAYGAASQYFPAGGSGGGGGTVSSVGLDDPTGTFTITNTPIVSSGVIHLNAFANQSAGAILGNHSAILAAPTWGNLVVGDLPSGAANTVLGNFTGLSATPTYGKVTTSQTTGIAASGANSDITSLSALSTPLSVGQGGTGTASLTGHGVVTVNSGGTAQTTVAPGSNGNVLTSNGTDWVSQASTSGSITVGTTSISGGTTGRLVYDNNGVIGEVVPNVALDDFRLSFNTTAVNNSDVTGASATAVHLAHILGRGQHIYTFATAWRDDVITGDISVSLPATTRTTYAVCIHQGATASADTLVLTAWTNLTTPPTHTTQDGVDLVGGDVYLGDVETADVAGQSADAPLAGQLLLYNDRNQVAREAQALQASSWNYSTTTWRGSNANTSEGAGRIGILCGRATMTISAEFLDGARANPAGQPTIAIALDSTTTPDTNACAGLNQTGNSGVLSMVAKGMFRPAVGYHYIQALEEDFNAGACTFYGAAGGVNLYRLSVRVLD